MAHAELIVRTLMPHLSFGSAIRGTASASAEAIRRRAASVGSLFDGIDPAYAPPHRALAFDDPM